MALDARFATIPHSLDWTEALRRAESGCGATTRTPAGYVTVYDNGYRVVYGADCQPVLLERQGYTWTPPAPTLAQAREREE